MRRNRFLVLPTLTFTLTLAAACGGDAAEEDVPPVDTSAVADAPVAESPGLRSDTSTFVPREGADAPEVSGRLWVAGTGPSQADGVSFVAQLRNVPARAYGWAVHRGACDQPDDLVLPLGFGTEADARSQTGGPLGRMTAAFEPSMDGGVEETVFLPLDGDLSRAELGSGSYSLRIHPEPGDDVVHPSVACAPIPPAPDRTGG